MEQKVQEKNKRGFVPLREEINEYYIVQNHTKKESAAFFNTSETNFSRWAKKYQIFKSPEKKGVYNRIASAKRREEAFSKLNVEEVRKYYIFECHTIQEAIKHFGVNDTYFRDFLKQYNIMKDPQQIANTIKRVTINKHGIPFYKTEETKKKTKQTCLERYGVENPSYVPDIQEKIRQKITFPIPPKEELYQKYIQENMTIQECASFYGVSSDLILRWNKQYGIKKEDHKRVENIQKTCMERYGYSTYTQTDMYKEKAKKQSLIKYGTINPAQKDIKHYDIWLDADKFISFLKGNKQKYTPYELKEYFNVSHSAILDKIHYLNVEDLVDIKAGRSQFETEIIDFLQKHGVQNIIQNDRQALHGKEIDIYLPDYHLGIEFNGEYYHSEKNPKYRDHNGRSTKHQEKSLLAASQGIMLFNIFEHEWDKNFIERNSSFKNSRINIENRLLMLTKHENYIKIPARKCVVKEIDYFTKKDFLNKNHIQGNDVTSNLFLGLFYQNELVACMTFGFSKYKKYNYELTRFCTKHDCIVQGGASKLFKYFVNVVLQKGECVVSYNDITKTSGKIYLILGFINTSINSPNYWWVNLSNYDIRTRYQEQAAGEVERMHEKGYCRICDCGTKTWVYTK